ncbi:larp7, partial [Symbiodinium sp. CCMP2456]
SLRVRLQLAAESDGELLCRKVVMVVPEGLSLVSDFLHYIYGYFRLQPTQPLAMSIEGFGLLPAQCLEDVLRDGDLVWVRPAQTQRRGPCKRRALTNGPALLALPEAKEPLAEENADEEVKQEEEESEGGEAEEADAEEEAAAEGAAAAAAPSNVAAGAEASATSAPETLPDAAAAKLWKPLSRAPLPGEVIRFRLRTPAGLTDFQAARCVGAGMVAGVSQVTLEQQGSSSSFPVDSLFQVGLFQAGDAPEEVRQKKEPSSAAKPAERRTRPTTEASPKKPRIQPPMDKHKLEQLRYAIRSQFDYYFGDANYAKDNFLRSQADDDGWTSLRLVAKFNRVRELTEDFEAVQRSLEDSAIVEVSECGEYVRKRNHEPDEPRD